MSQLLEAISMSRKLFLSALVFVFICAAPARATTVTASGAGPLPSSAEDLTGVVNLSEILGTVDFPLGVDMFKIDITNAADFSAITNPVAFGVPDTELFLFDSTGLGVYGNDDISFSNTLSCLPSADSGNPCLSSRPAGVGPVTDGDYYLAVTRSANDPQSSGGNIFSEILSTDVTGPDLGMGGGSPITNWDNNVNASPDFDLINFDITLTGTAPVTTPEPSTWALILAGLLFISLRRTRLARPPVV
jgi:hypothetical protein